MPRQQVKVLNFPRETWRSIKKMKNVKCALRTIINSKYEIERICRIGSLKITKFLNLHRKKCKIKKNRFTLENSHGIFLFVFTEIPLNRKFSDDIEMSPDKMIK